MLVVHWAPMACIASFCILLSIPYVFSADVRTTPSSYVGPLQHLTSDRTCLSRNPTFASFLLHCNHLRVSTSLVHILLSSSVFTVLTVALHYYVRRAYAARRRTLSDADALANQILCAGHAVVATATASTAFLFGGWAMWSTYAWHFGVVEDATLALSLGFFLVDAFAMSSLAAKHNSEKHMSIYIHHVACFVGITFSLAYRMGIPFCIALLFSEASTPFLQLRSILPTVLGVDRTHPVVRANGVAFVLSFVLVRNVFFVWQVWWLATTRDQWEPFPRFALAPSVFIFILGLLNLMWLPMVLSSVRRIEFGKGGRPHSHTQ
eukprot:TRINITY_DN51317_c0_g1_i1.p1 TRINITY_DN51317_c0_g1~~TRINITY_DN51317_c0_g1_i1.p1  ORF type:complete len:321 (-),score=44.02 TRINITY_DN51317_c0_g1_i1:184-1146(-)